jgi:type VI secretion system protein ImpH
MASENGHQTEAVALLEQIRQEPYRFGFYQAIRRINCAYPDLAPTGSAARPRNDAVRFGQTPHTSFAPSTLESLELPEDGEPPKLNQFFFGLFGPNGPLPTHLTEYARDRLRHHHDPAFARFADMFHHRMISLFYRAWSQAQPTVQADRPGHDRFSVYLGSLAGLGMPTFRGADAMPHAAKLHFTGHLSSLPRHAVGLASMLESYFGVPVRIVEFIGHWLRIPASDHLRLGTRPGVGRLGENAVLGEKVWQRQDKFQVRLGPLSLQEYEDFLPAGKSFAAMVAAIRNYLGLELLWEVRLLLKGAEKPATCLGKQGVLGWTSWLSAEHGEDVIGDLVLQAANYVD